MCVLHFLPLQVLGELRVNKISSMNLTYIWFYVRFGLSLMLLFLDRFFSTFVVVVGLKAKLNETGI